MPMGKKFGIKTFFLKFLGDLQFETEGKGRELFLNTWNSIKETLEEISSHGVPDWVLKAKGHI